LPSLTEALPGVVALDQIVHGHVCGVVPGVGVFVGDGVGVGVAVPGGGVLVGVGVGVGVEPLELLKTTSTQ
jgi:hypothetical protein